MPVEFPDASHTRQFFVPDADGSATIYDGDLVISFEGLKPLPRGSRYFLVMDATPVPSGPDQP